jgi:monoamine oxidase
MSVTDCINKHVPNGMNSPFGKLCHADAEGEYGSPAEQQSALNLMYILGYDDSAGGAGTHG